MASSQSGKNRNRKPFSYCSFEKSDAFILYANWFIEITTKYLNSETHVWQIKSKQTMSLSCILGHRK
jgi:hypothetical protein